MSSPLIFRIGLFLAARQIRRSSWWTNVLIVSVMVLTFLNLVIISGILVGLIQGAVDAYRTQYTGDVIISRLPGKSRIEHSQEIVSIARGLPQVEAVTERYMAGATYEANYKSRTDPDEKPNTASSQLVGINPSDEDRVTGLSAYIVEGEFLSPGDYDQIVLGSYLLRQYLPIDSPTFTTLEDVGVGSKIRVRVGDMTREVTVKGIVKTKVDEVSLRAYMVEPQVRSMIGRTDFNADEIAIAVSPEADPAVVRDALKRSGAGEFARVQTSADAEPKFIKDMKDTFALLGNMISSIGLVVASITIFIVIFINAITRRKFIGILKGIGVSGKAIEMSYVFQSVFYSTLGSVIGLALLYGFLHPFIAAHPIDFPFSDGILVAPASGTAVRIALLVVSTVIAGYIPARMIVRKNTLDSILGRT